MGIISAIGNNVAECLDALENERAGMGQMHQLDSLHRQRLPVAEVKLSNKELAEITGLSEIKSRTALLSLVAAREAIADAGIENFKDLRTGFISATSVGGMDMRFPGGFMRLRVTAARESGQVCDTRWPEANRVVSRHQRWRERGRRVFRSGDAYALCEFDGMAPLPITRPWIQ